MSNVTNEMYQLNWTKWTELSNLHKGNGTKEAVLNKMY